MKKSGLAYYSLRRRHFCTPVADKRYRDLTTGDEFDEHDDNAIRQVMPEDLLDATILVESTEGSKSHYIRVSYCDVQESKIVNDQIIIDIDKNGKLVGVKLSYPWPSR